VTGFRDIGGMSLRARTALEEHFGAGGSLEEAAERSDEELLSIPGFGRSSLLRLRQWQGVGSQGQELPPGEEELAREVLLELVRARKKAPPALAREAWELAREFVACRGQGCSRVGQGQDETRHEE